jgi:hypothetical protein
MAHLLDGANFSLHTLGNKHRSKLVEQIEITGKSVEVLLLESNL